MAQVVADPAAHVVQFAAVHAGKGLSNAQMRYVSGLVTTHPSAGV